MGYIGDKQQTRFSDDLFAQIYPHVSAADHSRD